VVPEAGSVNHGVPNCAQRLKLTGSLQQLLKEGSGFTVLNKYKTKPKNYLGDVQAGGVNHGVSNGAQRLKLTGFF